jgi:hypothetical protein
MATVSSGGANFSNGSQGTRGLSAGDWVRLQRLQGAKAYAATLSSNKDIAPPPTPQQPYNSAIHVHPVVGTSKIRRPASLWTDYMASQSADFVLQSQQSINGTSQKLTVYKVCKSCGQDTSTLTPRITGCKTCSTTPVHNRIQ